MKKTNKKLQKKTSIESTTSEEVLSLDQIEDRLMKAILSGSLALHILRSSRKPMSALTKELMEIEVTVGGFIGQAMRSHKTRLESLNVHGALANALSFIPFSASPIANELKKQRPSKCLRYEVANKMKK